MDILAFLSGLIGVGLAGGIWTLLKKWGLLKITAEDLSDRQTNRALQSTGVGLDTLERVIDQLEKRIVQQETDYNEDLTRLKDRYEEDTKLLKEEIANLRTILLKTQRRLDRYEEILRANNLLPDE